MPNTNLPITNKGKLGANAVMKAPTRYINAATSSSEKKKTGLKSIHQCNYKQLGKGKV
jgi:hypothetical protein